mgnify:CR=1 FL=1
MDVALGMLAQIVEQRVGAHERLVEVQIELAVVEQQSEGALVAVELGGKLLHIGYGLVDLGHGAQPHPLQPDCR